MPVKKTKKPVAKKTAAKKKPVAKKAAPKKKVAAKKATPKKKTVAKKPAAKKASAKKTTAKKAAPKKKVAAKKAAPKKKVDAKKTTTKKATPKKKVVAKKAAPKKKVAAKKAAPKKTTAKKAAPKKAVAKKPVAKKPAVKKPAAKKAPVAKKAAPKKPVTKKKPVKKTGKVLLTATPDVNTKKVNVATGAVDFEPYQPSKNEEYMSEAQIEHFRNILLAWKHQLVQEADSTVDHMQHDVSSFADPLDRAVQEEGFSLELRARDRDRKLLKKINKTLARIEEGDYGYCEDCGVEIGIRRLEARATAEKCIDCKTIAEIRERQAG